MDEEEYGYYDEDEDGESGDPQWRTLTPKERKVLLKNVFGNPEWYEEADGLPVFEGGTANPLFQEIATKAGAPVTEIKRYYAAWLKGQGYSPAEHLKPAAETTHSSVSSFASQSQPVQSNPVSSSPPISSGQPLPTLNMPETQKDDSGMWAMMQFLTQQQHMAMQQQQFQMQMQMEQRRIDQSKESDLRRETMARDQQANNQQMAFMRDLLKTRDKDSFFDTEFKSSLKDKFADSLFGEKDDSWKDMIKDVVGSDTVKAAVGGIGTALGSRNSQIPAGYDVPGYNPYAQQVEAPVMQPLPQQIPPEINPPIPQQIAPEPQLDGVFFDEGDAGNTEAPAGTQQPQQQVIQEINRDDYKNILFQSFIEMMGPAANDEHVLKALQEQIDITVDTSLIEYSESIPRTKLQKMTEKLLLIRNLRDIGQGLMELRQRTPPGSQPSPLVMAAVIEELKKRPEFYKIFAENSYEEIIAAIEPFKATGAVEVDLQYLLDPSTAEICRPLLVAVRDDAQNNGAPPIPGLD